MNDLDHVHIRVPDRDQAARWYAQHLGFERVERVDFWAKGFEGGPIQISADGGQTMLALFEANEGHPMIPQLIEPNGVEPVRYWPRELYTAYRKRSDALDRTVE